VGGVVTRAARLPGRDRFAALLAWWRAEAARLGVALDHGTDVAPAALADARRAGSAVLLATGGRPGPQAYRVEAGADVRTDADVLAAGPESLPDGPVVVLDLVGGPIGVGLAETLAAAGRQVAVVTGDQIVGTMLALSGDLADGNTRLLRAGVTRLTSRSLREVRPGTAVVEDRFSGERSEIACAVLVHCGHRVPEETLYLERPGLVRAGDCVAPRSVLEAVLEGRRAADAIETSTPSGAASSGPRPVATSAAAPGAERVTTPAGAR
jgi:2,4-dienoyl-CoA reductase (NADPH2)